MEPLTLQEVKDHLRVDASADDTLITALIQSAREGAEAHTNRALIEQTWELKLDAFPKGAIYIPKSPVQSVSSIQYIDLSGDTQTLAAADYIVDTNSEPARITPAYLETWPDEQERINAVTVTFVAGYSAGAGSPTDYAENVPELIKSAMKLAIGERYENREDTVVATVIQELPTSSKDLLNSYRVDYFTE